MTFHVHLSFMLAVTERLESSPHDPLFGNRLSGTVGDDAGESNNS